MRVWATVRKRQRILADVVREFPTGPGRPGDLEGWTPVIGELAAALDLSRPVILEKHVNELLKFSRTVFRPADFMEPVEFERFEIEIFPEKKKEGV